MELNLNAGLLASPSILVNIPKLISAYYTDTPDFNVKEQRVAFGTSGHRGSSFNKSFNEHHILAISQAICLYRAANQITGPLFIGIDTHALSIPALHTAIEVFAANNVTIILSKGSEYTPTPVISHAILTYNHGRITGFADGIVITPSHNPPNQGGFKYNPPNGGAADETVTLWIETKANELLKNGLSLVKRMPVERALKLETTHYYDYLNPYVDDLKFVIDMEKIRVSKIRLAVDPLGGAGIDYWPVIADRYKLDLTIVNKKIDPTFSFMTVDWDGQIRMDPSSCYAMKQLIDLKDQFDLVFACDTDHDRHGIVTKSVGLMPSNHYLSAALDYLLRHRPLWPKLSQIGKSIVSSRMIDLVAAKHQRHLYEVPAGFKWFASGLYSGDLAFGCEESAGASFARFDGSSWTTDKDGIILGLLAAEMTAHLNKDPGIVYQDLTREFGSSFSDRVEAKASSAQKAILKKLSPEQIQSSQLAGEPILSIETKASGNGAAIGGVKVNTKQGWFAARPSGTEDIYKIYAESFESESHLNQLLQEAQVIVNQTLGETHGI